MPRSADPARVQPFRISIAKASRAADSRPSSPRRSRRSRSCWGWSACTACCRTAWCSAVASSAFASRSVPAPSQVTGVVVREALALAAVAVIVGTAARAGAHATAFRTCCTRCRRQDPATFVAVALVVGRWLPWLPRGSRRGAPRASIRRRPSGTRDRAGGPALGVSDASAAHVPGADAIAVRSRKR